ncbi:MAG: tRNA pseudouridine(55) synthase TruB [bacterium]|jgi:tRNA pseudouridine55 synthase|nr:tRNA pseudouridine(55) synthase TruB [bacterium]MDD4152507.1 tRNA pseudouridine(55) synthase TruB [bacterium]
MNGYLKLIKPPGMTSHDLVSAVRHITGERRVGHAGTLDPAAAGLMILALGQGTRLMEYAVAERKSYRVEMVLGVETDTQDTTGSILSRYDAADVKLADLLNVVRRFKGEYKQIPPMMSAIKIGGKRLYKLARQGYVVERAFRQVHIYDLEVVDFISGEAPIVMMDVICSGGTYIRTLCYDIGASLGCGAAMSFLVRRSSGKHRIDEACTLHDLFEKSIEAQRLKGIESPGPMLTDEDFMPFMHKIDGLASSLPAVSLDKVQAERFKHGRIVPARVTASGDYRVYEEEKGFIGIAEMRLAKGIISLKPKKVLDDVSF